MVFSNVRYESSRNPLVVFSKDLLMLSYFKFTEMKYLRFLTVEFNKRYEIGTRNFFGLTFFPLDFFQIWHRGSAYAWQLSALKKNGCPIVCLLFFVDLSTGFF